MFCASTFGALKRGFRNMASVILVRNVVGELRPKRTLAASRGFLAAARLSCCMIYPCDGRTDGRAIAYSALSIYAICCRALKTQFFKSVSNDFQKQTLSKKLSMSKVLSWSKFEEQKSRTKRGRGSKLEMEERTSQQRNCLARGVLSRGKGNCLEVYTIAVLNYWLILRYTYH